MKNEDSGRVVVLGGIEYDVVFASEVSDDQRIELGLPARGAHCSCDDCACDNQADAGTIEHPMCGAASPTAQMFTRNAKSTVGVHLNRPQTGPGDRRGC